MCEIGPKLDAINKGWKDLEQRLSSYKVPPVSGTDGLAIDRVNGRWRITYRGRPILDCTAVERVEAVDEVPLLIVARNLVIEDASKKADEAIAKLSKCLEGLGGIL